MGIIRNRNCLKGAAAADTGYHSVIRHSINTLIYEINNFCPFKTVEVYTSVAEPHHFYAGSAPAPTLLYSRSKFLKGIKVNIRSA
jgi:hypothetical protein